MNDETAFGTIVVAIVAGGMASPAFRKFRHVFCVPEGWTGLLYQHGLYVRRNNAGRHVIWGRGWTITLVDLRKSSLLIAGQEVLTADHVGIGMSLIVTHQLTDPVKAAHETQNAMGDVSNAAQLALRTVVGAMAVEALLDHRLEIGARLLDRVQAETAKIGITVLAVEVKDVIVPAELKQDFAGVLKAKQKGQALERAHGGAAALRNL